MKIIKKLKVGNPMGLHTRPAAYIVKSLSNIKSEVFFSYHEMTINAKSIMGILMLAARKNARITVTVEGEDATDTMFKITEAFLCQFGE